MKKSTKTSSQRRKNMAYTDDKGVSYYKIGNRYFSNTGWLVREISKELYQLKMKEKDEWLLKLKEAE